MEVKKVTINEMTIEKHARIFLPEERSSSLLWVKIGGRWHG